MEEDTIFVGAGDNQDGEKGKAFLILLSLFGECEVIGSHVFDEKTEFNLVSIIKRHPTENTLFIGTQRYLVIGQWLQSRFVIFEKYDNSLDFPISDICYHEEALYLTCDNVRGMIIHFDDRIIRNRDPRLNNTRIEKLQYSKLKEKNLVNSKKESAGKSNVQNSLISPEPGRHMKDSNASSSDIGDLKPLPPQKTTSKTPIDVEESKISTVSVLNIDDSMNPKRIDSDASDVSLRNSRLEDNQKGLMPRVPGNLRNSLFKSTDILGGQEGIGGNKRNPKAAEFSKLYQFTQVRKIPLGEEEHMNDGLHRIDFTEGSSDMQVFYGKGMLHRLKAKASHFIKGKEEANRGGIKPFIDMKVYRHNRILVFEEATLDLVKYDFAFKEQARLKGMASKCLSKAS